MSFKLSEKFNLYKKDKIAEKKTKVYFYEHKKTKAQVLFYDCENVNASFGIYFKTPVSDSTGITHILEHSVFEGSRKYNQRGNLDYLLNNSLATFLNAGTFQDRTMYYFSSSFKKDFLNIMDIYLDFVFFPLLDEKTFQREGFFYTKENGKYDFNGIVFNEMKDSLLGYERRNYYDNLKHLFPNSTFAHLQGGDPVEIVDLSVNDVRKYHKDYYHPSNSYTIVYGKIDKKKVFQKLDEYFSEFEYKDIQVEHKIASISEPKKATDYYQDYLEDGLVSYSKSIVFDKPSFEDEVIFNFIVDLLFKFDFSPMKRALEDSGLINSISSVYFDNFNNIPYFKIDFRGLEEQNISKISELFNKTLKNLSKRIEPELKNAVFKKKEFATKEFNFYEGQGIDFIIESSTPFMLGENPIDGLKGLKVLKILKKNLKGKKLENFIKTKFINNPRVFDFTLKPSASVIDEYKESLKLKLEEKLKLMDFKKLDREIEEFEKWREIPKKEISYPSQKKIKTKDLEVSLVKYNSKYEDKIFQTIVPSEDITRVELSFDISKLDLHKIEYFSIYLYVMYYLSSKKYNFEQFNILKSKYLSAVNVDIKNYNDQKNEKGYLQLFFSYKYLNEDFEHVLHIFDEMVNHTIFNDKERLKFLINEYFQTSKDGIDSNFRENSQFILGKYLTPFGDVYESIKGLSLIKKLERINKNFNHEFDELVTELEKIHKFVFSSKLVVNLGTSEKYASVNLSDTKKFIKKLNLNLVDKKDIDYFENPHFTEEFPDMNFYHQINSDTNFNFVGIKYPAFPKDKIHQLKFVSEYLTQHFFEIIRINRGAYGAGAKVFPFDNATLFSSWQDPFINESFKTFLNYSKNYEVSKFNKLKFEKIKKQLVASFKKIYTNGQIFRHSFENFMTNRTHKDREQDLYETRTLTYLEFKELFKLFKNPKYVIKLVCTNKDNIKNFNEKYNEIKGL